MAYLFLAKKLEKDILLSEAQAGFKGNGCITDQRQLEQRAVYGRRRLEDQAPKRISECTGIKVRQVAPTSDSSIHRQADTHRKQRRIVFLSYCTARLRSSAFNVVYIAQRFSSRGQNTAAVAAGKAGEGRQPPCTGRHMRAKIWNFGVCITVC